jgi:ABC-2 type transport system ATP-binding protein
MQNRSEHIPLRVTALAKRFPGGAGIDGVSLSVPAGSITGFIGANGAGKSTTLRCVLGLIRPDSGQIRLFGAPPSRSARALIGFLPEERGLFAQERAREAIAFHGRLKGMERRQAYLAADALLERIGLGGRERTRIGALSKGNAQRVQVLCALVHRPHLLILDEPFSGLDPMAQSEMHSLFSEFRNQGGAILYSTHAMASAQSQCDRVVILADGRTLFEGTMVEASERAPHGAVVVTADGVGLLAALAVMGGQARPLSSASGQATSWHVVLPHAITHAKLIHALAERAVPVIAHQPLKPDLEGAFWNLAVRGAPAQSLAA